MLQTTNLLKNTNFAVGSIDFLLYFHNSITTQ